MPSRWTPAPAVPVRRSRNGPGLLVSAAGAVFAIIVFSLTLLVAAAMLLPAGFGSDGIAGGAGAGAASAVPSPAIASPATAGAVSSAVPAASAVAPAAAILPPRSLPGASPEPEASGVASSPAPTDPPVETAFRRPVPIVVGDRRVGRVAVQGLRLGRDTALPIPDDHRLMLATVRYTATARLAYDAAQWQLEGRDGERWEALEDAPGTALGRGTLTPRQARTGVVAFAVPRGAPIRAVILTDADGKDIAAFRRPPTAD